MTHGPWTTVALPDAGQAPVFREPWEAHAFAMVLVLHQRGLFSWREWADALAAQIAAARAEGDADLGDTYYRYWLRALEYLVAAKGAGSDVELSRYREAWDHAADRTPHGQPIELEAGDFSLISDDAMADPLDAPKLLDVQIPGRCVFESDDL